ncbi:hypothetical protein HJFPF1_09427 [Paramyrothecium foliicola]|nr:hypothetical protein HJFPF1_09427 [Paramyrothecium foliicola]
MGFLSFLNRVSSSHDHKSIKSQAYHLTAPATPPIRGKSSYNDVKDLVDVCAGSYPLVGNQSSEILSKAANQASSSQLSVHKPEQWVPPSGFRRSRATSDARPSAAKLESDTEPPRPKSAGRNSRYTNGNGPPYLLSHPLRKPAIQGDVDPMPPVPSIAALGRKTGYVDILDAQSDLKPSNFRARLLATGARDYGEDVAERNMGTSVLPSTATTPRAIGSMSSATTRASSVAPRTPTVQRRNRITHMSSTLSEDEDDAEDHGAPAPVIATGDQAKKRHVVRRRKSQRIGRRSGLTSPTVASTRASSKARVIRSAPNGSQTSLATTEKRPSYGRSKTAESIHDRPASHRMSVSEHSSTATKSRPRPRPLSLNQIIPTTPYDGGASPPAIPRYKRHAASSQDSLHAKPTKSMHKNTNRAQRRSSSVDANITKPFTKINAESHLWVSSSEDDGPYLPFASLPASRPTSRGTAAGVYRSSTKDVHSSANLDFEKLRPRTQSLGGVNLPNRPPLYDISEHVPRRRSSLAAQSSSTTLTTLMSNEHSSNTPYTRPDSQHTAATSVELYSGKSTSASDTSPSLKSGGRPPSSAYYTAMEDLVGNGSKQALRNNGKSVAGPNRQSQATILPTYDYGETDSSDADSFICPEGSKRLDGEALLFRPTGYGGRGNDLPGLSDMLDGYDMDEQDWERHLTIPSFQDWYIGTTLRSPDANKPHRTPFLSSESEAETAASMEESSINDAEFVSDVGEEQAMAIKHMRLSAMGGIFPRLVGKAIGPGSGYSRGIDEQNGTSAGQEWGDIGATMKMRKQMKRQQRSQSRSSATTFESSGRRKSSHQV